MKIEISEPFNEVGWRTVRIIDDFGILEGTLMGDGTHIEDMSVTFMAQPTWDAITAEYERVVNDSTPDND